MHECLFQTILLSTYCASCFKGRWFSRLVAIGHYVVISIFRGTRLLSMVWMAANSCVMLMSNRMLKYQWMHKITLQRWAKIILCVSFCVFSMVWCAFTGISVTICNLGGTVTVSLRMTAVSKMAIIHWVQLLRYGKYKIMTEESCDEKKAYLTACMCTYIPHVQKQSDSNPTAVYLELPLLYM